MRFTSKEDMLSKAEILLKNGWECLRLAPAVYESSKEVGVFEPRESIAILSEWLVELRAMAGKAVTIGIDYHHRLSIPETVSFMQRMPVGTIDFL